ncbi:MAG: DUF3426 domain-containing protein [Pseudomonadales bacterium]|nr:DUF3426 domain-containing protein [Pseudomonadales bacterium]
MIHTQCPRCTTTFRVTDEQIRAALGTVKCGPCSHIFSATEHQTSEQKADQSKTSKDSVENPAPNENAVATENEESPQPVQEETGDKPQPSDLLRIHAAEISDVELSDDAELSETFKSLSISQATALEHTNDLSDDDFLSSTDDDDESDEAWAKSLLMAHPETTISSEKNSVAKPEEANVTEADVTEAEEDIDLPGDEIGDIPGINIQMTETEFSLADFDIEPTAKVKKNGLLWATLALVALVSLTGQLGFFYFEKLAIHERLRPAYQLLCDTFDCELPIQQDISSIAASGLSIRPHQTIPAALTVELILTNNALFPQPFPEIELEFSDLDQRLVANRVFNPDEYLSGEVTGLAKMPMATPIHLSFEIKHPGEQAANFNVKVVR